MIEDQALAALARWGVPDRRPRLIKQRENAVFEVHLTDGTHAALRLHRPGYQSLAAIRSELLWCADLCARGFPAVQPIPTLDGALCADSRPRAASLLRWCDGRQIGAAGEPLPGTAADRAALLARVGDLIARLHDATDAFAPPADFQRPAWNTEGLVGEAPLWGRFWESPALTPAEARHLAGLRHDLRDALENWHGDYGLIHSDVLRENLLAGPDGLSLIDFDDCGWGYRSQDLASALSQSLGDADLAAQARALLAGYAARRDPGPRPERRLTLFLTLRALASVGWLASRAAPSDPRQRIYIDRALAIARLWRDGGSVTEARA